MCICAVVCNVKPYVCIALYFSFFPQRAGCRRLHGDSGGGGDGAAVAAVAVAACFPILFVFAPEHALFMMYTRIHTHTQTYITHTHAHNGRYKGSSACIPYKRANQSTYSTIRESDAVSDVVVVVVVTFCCISFGRTAHNRILQLLTAAYSL